MEWLAAVLPQTYFTSRMPQVLQGTNTMINVTSAARCKPAHAMMWLIARLMPVSPWLSETSVK